MKRLLLTIVVLFSLTTLVSSAQRRSNQSRRIGGTLTLQMAQGLLKKQLNEPSVNNMIFTCRACYSFDDKEENDNFAVVSTYVGVNQFLRSQGYIRLNNKREEVFTAKAKRSKSFQAYGDGFGGFGGAGFRFANFRNPRILSSKITDPKNVPIEYDLVPTEVTMRFFGKAARTKSYASFSFENRRWSICIACRN